MSQELRQYYEEELNFFGEMAREFTQKYPKIAARLRLDESKDGKDPHVERLIQAYALLTARVRRKIDDEFPEIVESFLNMLYPHYLRPIPPMAIAQFRVEPQQMGPTEPPFVAAGSPVSSQTAGGLDCTFRTAYPVTVWPLKLNNASVGTIAAAQVTGAPAEASSVLRIHLETLGNLPFAKLKCSSLRFFIDGESTQHHLLYELLLVHAVRVQLRGRSSSASSEPVVLRADCIQPVGFGVDEGLLDYSDRSFVGYRLLQEYFHFPQKFFFFDLAGLDSISLDQLGNSFEILIFFRNSELQDRMASIAQVVNAETFKLGCTPIVNLFERSAETIRVTHAVTEYRVIPDRHRETSTEVYSVDRVTSTASYAEEPVVYEPFYSFRHGSHDEQQCFWYAHRRPSMRKDDDGTDVYLSLVDLDFKPTNPPVELVSLRVTCTNRDFVSRIQWRKEWGELQGEGLPLVQARCVVPPTKTARPPLRGGLQWRLISHLSLNHLSIVQNGGREALQEILRLYAFDEDDDIQKRIAGITGLKSASSVSRVLFDSGIAFCRGLDVEIEFDEENYVGSGVFLLASVLERFFGLYSAINSYSRLTARTQQRRNVLKRWAPRVGEQGVL